jgi:hypothetical protein
MLTQNKIETHKESVTPIDDIRLITPAGQDPKRRMFRPGYRGYLGNIPVLRDGDELLIPKLHYAQGVMEVLADRLIEESWFHQDPPPQMGFDRTILAIEPPTKRCLNGQSLDAGFDIAKENAEIIVARWGDGHSSPVHGHANGFLHESILSGKMRVNIYRLVDETTRKVRLVKTNIESSGTFLSTFTPPSNSGVERNAYIHNFTSIGNSATLHFIPEHTRDGRDNRFEVEYFEDLHELTEDMFDRITSKEGLQLKRGEVVLVRSTNVPEYGDHYIVITGSPVMKEHGMRPQDEAIYAPNTSALLDKVGLQNGLTLLRMKPFIAEKFLQFHDIKVEGNSVIFPNA